MTYYYLFAVGLSIMQFIELQFMTEKSIRGVANSCDKIAIHILLFNIFIKKFYYNTRNFSFFVL